jgi:cell division protein FtsB
MENHSENIDSQKSSPSEKVWVRSPLQKVWVRSSFLRNKYLITGVAFLAWMIFIDRNDIPTQWKRIQEVRTLEQSEKAMNKQISDTKHELDLLKTSPATLEKYAREKYMMKKENEDLYILTSAK